LTHHGAEGQTHVGRWLCADGRGLQVNNRVQAVPNGMGCAMVQI
jgi:hypothetical protein